MTLQELFDRPERWTQGAYARDHHNESVDLHSPDAQCFCLRGGVLLCYEGHHYRAILDMIQAHVKRTVSGWNDAPERTFDDIRQLVTELNI